jgi:hypothetical protein
MCSLVCVVFFEISVIESDLYFFLFNSGEEICQVCSSLPATLQSHLKNIGNAKVCVNAKKLG